MCNCSKPTLIVLVLSKRSNIKERQAIRETWGSQAGQCLCGDSNELNSKATPGLNVRGYAPSDDCRCRYKLLFVVGSGPEAVEGDVDDMLLLDGHERGKEVQSTSSEAVGSILISPVNDAHRDDLGSSGGSSHKAMHGRESISSVYKDFGDQSKQSRASKEGAEQLRGGLDSTSAREDMDTSAVKASVPDNYDNLVLKLEQAWMHIDRQYSRGSVHWILKVDDDCMTRVDRVYEWLERHSYIPADDGDDNEVSENKPPASASSFSPNTGVLSSVDSFAEAVVRWNPLKDAVVLGDIVFDAPVQRQGRWGDRVSDTSVYPPWPRGSSGYVVSRAVLAEVMAMYKENENKAREETGSRAGTTGRSDSGVLSERYADAPSTIPLQPPSPHKTTSLRDSLSYKEGDAHGEGLTAIAGMGEDVWVGWQLYYLQQRKERRSCYSRQQIDQQHDQHHRYLHYDHRVVGQQEVEGGASNLSVTRNDRAITDATADDCNSVVYITSPALFSSSRKCREPHWWVVGHKLSAAAVRECHRLNEKAAGDDASRVESSLQLMTDKRDSYGVGEAKVYSLTVDAEVTVNGRKP
jgi:hypothetical protein